MWMFFISRSLCERPTYVNSSNSLHKQSQMRLAGYNSVWGFEKTRGFSGDEFLCLWFDICTSASVMVCGSCRNSIWSHLQNGLKYISSVVFICICCKLKDFKWFIEHPSVHICCVFYTWLQDLISVNNVGELRQIQNIQIYKKHISLPLVQFHSTYSVQILYMLRNAWFLSVLFMYTVVPQCNAQRK